MNYDNKEFLDEFQNLIRKINPQKVFFVCSNDYDRYGYRKALDEMNVKSYAFTSFEPCPEVSSVSDGIKAYKKSGCVFVVAVGGGSAIDTAKGIKYHSKLDFQILAVPTTAGTGAEVTRFSVLYRGGDKESVSDFSIIPEYAVLDYKTLKSLPYNQRVVTALDAFCHSVEAYWSVDATDESRECSCKAIKLYRENSADYFNFDDKTLENMMQCSMLAGKAINIARTTAPHAFSYKLHKLLGFNHGRAVAVCLAYIWKYMLENGGKNLAPILDETEKITGFTPDSFISYIDGLGMLDGCEMTRPQFEETVNGVNTARLKNHPMPFTDEDIRAIYSSFIKIKQ